MLDFLTTIRALGDESRLRILWTLEDDRLCVRAIQEILGLAQSTVSRHLQILEDAGLLKSSRSGLRKDYRLNPSPDPLGQSLLALVRLAGATTPVSAEVRRRAAEIRRQNPLCGPRSAA